MQHTRSNYWDEVQDPDRFAELDALDIDDSSSLSPPTSPSTPRQQYPAPSRFLDDTFPSDDIQDPSWVLDEEEEAQGRRPPQTKRQKVSAVFEFMKAKYPRFSLKDSLTTLFDPAGEISGSLKTALGIFFANGGGELLMDTVWNYGLHLQREKYHESMAKWVFKTAGVLCDYECSHLTDTASKGPHYDDEIKLRVNAEKVTVSMVRNYKLEHLTAVYDRTLPWTQKILSSIMNKDFEAFQPSSRNADDVS